MTCPARLLLLMATLTGCAPRLGESAESTLDADGDGWTRAEGDCDDADPATWPGAEEVVADGRDQDCNGGDACWRDSDQDGWGAAPARASVDLDCEDVSESANRDDCDDCDDQDDSVHPEAAEVIADGRDQDCDGREACYQDADGDGFGAPTTIGSADLDCADPGEADDGTDCLDEGPQAAATWPGAAPSDSASACMQDADGDTWGAAVPHGAATPGTDCDDADPATWPGAEERCGDGLDQDCAGGDERCRFSGTAALRDLAFKLTGEDPYDCAGLNVSSAGDVDADGRDDLLIGAAGGAQDGNAAVAAYLLYGPVTGDRSLALADVRLFGEDDEAARYPVSSAGDVDADGFGDLLIGAPYADPVGTWSGQAFLLYGPVRGDLDLQADADAVLWGEAEWRMAGLDVSSAGDVDGDGFGDLLVGAPGDDQAQDRAGAAWLVLGASAWP